MFAGSDDGARRTAILYAVISTAVLCGVEPWAYVRDLLEKIISGFPQRRIDDLLPDAWGLLHAGSPLASRPGRRTGRLSPRALAPPRHPTHPDAIRSRLLVGRNLPSAGRLRA
jgi:IS66 C-terminal element